MTDDIDKPEKGVYYLYSLDCPACGHDEKRRLTQFAEIPSCPNCRGQLLVGNATPLEEGN